MKESEIWGERLRAKGTVGRTGDSDRDATGRWGNRNQGSERARRDNSVNANNESDTTAPRPRDTTAGLGAESGHKAQTCERRAARGSNLEKELKGQLGKAAGAQRDAEKDEAITHKHTHTSSLYGYKAHGIAR